MINLIEDSRGIVVFARTPKIVGFEDMINGMEFIESNESLPRELRIIEDATGSEADFSIAELRKLIDKMQSVSAGYKFIKHAVIHDNPKNTAFAYIVQNQKRSSNYNLQVFATREGAINWIGYDGEL